MLPMLSGLRPTQTIDWEGLSANFQMTALILTFLKLPGKLLKLLVKLLLGVRRSRSVLEERSSGRSCAAM